MSEQNELILESFEDLNLSPNVMRGLKDVGYETPTPIQAEIIPFVMEGRDVLGQAQTGTGKTAAFALPLLSKINTRQKEPQVLVLTPTRELAIQVAEAFQKYAARIRGFHVLPIYGGQDYTGQLRQLKRGAHVVVGTPGRVMDHMRRGTLILDGLQCLVLDEADEMLRMGFIDDVEWILEQTPEDRQIALFSATLPREIRRIAKKHLENPQEITIKVKTTTAETIRQRFWMGSGYHKLEALTRILEAETFDGMIVFVRTKTATIELAEKLEARGFASAPLNGDIAQKQRERTVERFKKGELDILVATDVAARGLDVDRVSHVVNYDIPYDTESYVHRVGRTGRAGRSGEAILFVAPRERRMLRAIEKATNQRIELMDLPSTESINVQRIARFKQRITDALENEDLSFFQGMLAQYQVEHDVAALDIAAALGKLLQGNSPLLLPDKPMRSERPERNRRENSRERKGFKKDKKSRRKKASIFADEGMGQYIIDVGYNQGIKPGNIVGAIANEAGLASDLIGQIEIYDDFSTVDLPENLPREVLRSLNSVWVFGYPFNLRPAGDTAIYKPGKKKKKGKGKKGGSRKRKK